MKCPECKREITIAPLTGKPFGVKGYCVGFETCSQRPPYVPTVGDRGVRIKVPA